MVTEKKNQHYIPKFYLRNFSYQNNKKQIGVFNLENELFVLKGKLKTQGSKNFFYGFDGVIEDGLADIEGELAQVIKSIIENKTVPKKDSKEHFDLLAFVALTDLRNPVRIENMKSMLIEMKRRLLETDPDVDTSKFVPNASHEEMVRLSLANTIEMINYIKDLDFKLLINETNRPFISSDFPIVKYNQFLEAKKWQHSKTGYATVGLQIFIPLTSEIALIFFDSGIYKVADKKRNSLVIDNTKDIDSINLLQFINCFETIYFNERAKEAYIKQMFKISKQYKRANVTQSQLSYLLREGADDDNIVNSGQKNLMILSSSDCETKLQIEGLKTHSNGKSYRFHESVAQLRPHAKRLMKMKNSR